MLIAAQAEQSYERLVTQPKLAGFLNEAETDDRQVDNLRAAGYLPQIWTPDAET